MIRIESGYVNFRDDDLVEIKQGTGRAFLNSDEVLKQIGKQLAF